MATRFYLSSTAPVGIAPAFAAFTEVDGMLRQAMQRIKGASAMTDHTTALTAGGAGGSQGIRQYISDPMAAQTIAAGTIKGTIRCFESGVNDNIDGIRMSLRVCNNAGTAFGGTAIMALGSYGPVNEFATSLTARRIADGDATTAVTVADGDRLVLDIGYVTSVGGTTISGTLNFGDNSATDLGDNETDTAANNPFIELSVNVVFPAVLSMAGLLHVDSLDLQLTDDPRSFIRARVTAALRRLRPAFA